MKGKRKGRRGEERENMYNIREQRKENKKAEKKNKLGIKRKDSDKGSVCVYHTGVCQQGQGAK